MKNTLLDLNNHLFAQIERLGDESLKPEELEREVERSRAIAGLADRVISNASVVLKAHEAAHNYGKIAGDQGKVLGLESDKK